MDVAILAPDGRKGRARRHQTHVNQSQWVGRSHRGGAAAVCHSRLPSR